MPNELIPFNEVELPIYPIVGYERGLPIVECQRNDGRGAWYFNCPFCGSAHSHYVGKPNPSYTAEISQRPRQRVRGECKRPGSPFHLKEYYIREEGDEKNGKWDKYLNLLESHRGGRYVRKKGCSMLALFGEYCLIFDDPNAVTSNLELGRAWLAFCEHAAKQLNLSREPKNYTTGELVAIGVVKAPLTLDLQTGGLIPQESNHAFSRKFHATFPQLRRKRLRDGVTRQWAFVGVQVDWLKLGRI